MIAGGAVTNNVLHDNGQYGVNGWGSAKLVVSGNEIFRNNWAHYNAAFGAGGSKFTRTTGLEIKNNCVHDNFGPGLWTDIDNRNTTYDANIVFNNDGEGIFHEISYDAVIKNNVIGHNGKINDYLLYGSNILISTSQNVEVTGNYVEVDASHGYGIGIQYENRGSGYSATNNSVRNNTVVYVGSKGLTGARTDSGANLSSNRFDANAYHAALPWAISLLAISRAC